VPAQPATTIKQVVTPSMKPSSPWRSSRRDSQGAAVTAVVGQGGVEEEERNPSALS
jgi:hypothetical protein